MVLILVHLHAVFPTIPRKLVVKLLDGVALRLQSELADELFLHFHAHVANVCGIFAASEVAQHGRLSIRK